MTGVRIPLLGERVGTPRGGVQGGHIDTPDASQVGNALTRVGHAGEDLLATLAENKRLKKAEDDRQAEEDAKAFAAKAVPQMALDLDKMDTDARAAAQPGAAGYTDGLQKQVDGYLADAEKNAPTPQSKQYIAEHGASLRAQVLGKAYAYEVGERQANRVSQVEEGGRLAEIVVGQDPGQFAAVRHQQHDVIDAMDAPPEVKRKLHENVDRNLSTAAVIAEAEKDPLGAEVKLRQRLGMDAGASPMDNEALYRSIEHTESRGKQGAVSPVGARGVMQLMPDTARELEKKYGFPVGSSDKDERINRELGRRYFDEQLTKYGDQATALIAYNWGPGRVDKWIESGRDPKRLPDETRKYVASILGSSTTVDAHAEPARTGEPAYDLLDTQQAITLLGHVQAERARQDQGFRTYVSSRVQDDNAAALDGKPSPRPLTAVDFDRAYGETGPAEFAQYQARQATGAKIPALATLSPEQLAATVKAAEPQPGPGYAAASQNYSVLSNAAQQVQTERATDPVAFAMRHNLGGVKPLDLSQPDARDQLRSRQANASAMSEKYGTPYRLLSTNEATQLTGRLQVSTPAEKVELLGRLRGALDDTGYRSIVDAIAPSQPLTASAAAYLGMPDRSVPIAGGRVTGAQVADRVLAGQELLSPAKGGTKVEFAADKLLRDEFTASVGGAYRGQAAAQERAFGAYRAYYAATANSRGLINSAVLNSDIADEALQAVTGGIAHVNDQAVVLPWGIGEEKFTELAKSYWPRAKLLAGLPETTPFEHASFAPAGGDRYYVLAGDTPLHKKDGGLVTMQVNLASTPVPATGMNALAESYGSMGF